MRLPHIFTNTTPIKFGEIKYFHPSGRTTLPDGHPIQKGGFIHECSVNSNSFESSLCTGYCIVLPSNHPEVTRNDISAVIDYMVDSSGIYTIGNYFKGRYIADTGELFNENSTAIGIEGLSSRQLVKLVEHISMPFSLGTLLIKSFSDNKIFITHRKLF